jgi:hypothetical protein
MSVNLNSAHSDRHNQSTNLAVDTSDDYKDAPHLAELVCKKGKAPDGARKRPSDEEFATNNNNNNDPKYTLASCNSAFLRGLFEDIANTSTCMVTEDSEDEPQPKVSDDAELTFYVPSEHSMAKRRMVSTTKSLERCEHALSNMLSSLIMTLGTPNTTTMPAAKDFPTTVSASLSFHQRSETMTLLDDDKVAPARHCESSMAEGEFGWFVDTDIASEEQAPTADPYASTFIPLAFCGSTAPRASHHNDRAEEEWAQAADTVDEVLGDLFF